MKSCSECGYYGIVACEKTGEKRREVCENFRWVTTPLYARICGNCRFYNRDKCGISSKETEKRDKNSSCIHFASMRLHIKSGKCKDCKYYDEKICGRERKKKNPQYGCKNFSSYK